jgi:alkanesulfonate monooxygenase SsuD/methylene tetrahydromethanopterin reductase-like flavin-dependent oxidoreductase (luciferase family)
MPLLSPPVSPGRLGLILPPMPPVNGSRTSSTTISPTFGSTSWVTEIASGAEAAGAGGVWATDHLFWGRPAPECLTSLAVAATATRHAAVGTCVLQLPLRAPAAVAKQAASLQALSGGRFVLGVGAGSHEGEYELAGVPFHTRGQALDAGMAALRAAWNTAERPGGYRLEPAAPVPVWVGGASPAAIRRAAAVGDGWVPLFLPPEQFAASLDRLRDLAADAGRDPGTVVPAVVMVVSVGEDVRQARSEGTAWLSCLYGIPPKAFERHLVAGPPGHCAAVAGAYAEAGAAHVIAFVAGDDALGQFRALAGAYGGLRSTSRGVEGGAREARDDNFQMAEVGA